MYRVFGLTADLSYKRKGGGGVANVGWELRRVILERRVFIGVKNWGILKRAKILFFQISAVRCVD